MQVFEGWEHRQAAEVHDMLTKAQRFYVQEKVKGSLPQDILVAMIQAGFHDLERINALRALESMSLKEARAFKEVSEPWLRGTATQEDYEEAKQQAIAANPTLADFFR